MDPPSSEAATRQERECEYKLSEILSCLSATQHSHTVDRFRNHFPCARCELIEKAYQAEDLLSRIAVNCPGKWSAGYFPSHPDRTNDPLRLDQSDLMLQIVPAGDEWEIKLTRTDSQESELFALILPGDSVTDRIFLFFCSGSKEASVKIAVPNNGAASLEARLPIVGAVVDVDDLDNLLQSDNALCERFLSCYKFAQSSGLDEWSVLVQHVISKSLESDTTPQFAEGLQMSNSPARTAESAFADHQRRLSEFIRGENARLDRLIMNLYMLFTLESLPDQDMFFSACHGIAEYFQSTDCSILLTRYEETTEDSMSELVKTGLQLYGAFGAWERAFNSPFVRRWQPVFYEFPNQLTRDMGNTPFFWWSNDPQRLPHRGSFIKGKHRLRGVGVSDIPYQQVWLSNSLGRTGRNLLGMSIRRPRRSSDEILTPADGVLKVENRRPRDIAAFREGHSSELLLDEIWRITALRAYVRYLTNVKPDKRSSLNEVGWKRLYEEQAPNVTLFADVRRGWYDFQNQIASNSENAEIRTEEVMGRLNASLRHLNELLRFVTLAETFLQHVRNCLRFLFIPDFRGERAARERMRYDILQPELNDDGEPIEQHIPSLFNIVNTCTAWKPDEAGTVNEDRRKLRAVVLTALDLEKVQELTSDLEQSLFSEARIRVETGVEQAVEQLKKILLGKLNWNDTAIEESIRDVFIRSGGALDSLNYKPAYREIGSCLVRMSSGINKFATTKIYAHNTKHEPSDMRITDGYRRMRRCAIKAAEVLAGILNGDDDSQVADASHHTATNDYSGTAWYDPELVSNDPLEHGIANALGEAAMHAHTYAEVDEARLLFISRRLSQLLTNRIIARAKRRKISISHEQVACLSIDDFALESLSKIGREIKAISELLRRAFEWYCGAKGDHHHLPNIKCREWDLRQLLVRATRFARNDAQNLSPRCPLVSITCDGHLPVLDELIRIEDRPNDDRLKERPWQLWLEQHGQGQNDDDVTLFEICLGLSANEDDYAQTHWLWDLATQLTSLRSRLSSWLDNRETSPDMGEFSITEKLAPPTRTTAPQNGISGKLPPPAPEDTWKGRLQKLRLALDEVILRAESLSGNPKFFDDLGSSLNKLCERIAGIMESDSCAVFFLDDVEDSPTKGKMVLRGACGRVGETLSNAKTKENSPEDDSKDVPGVVYKSRWPDSNEDRARFEKFTSCSRAEMQAIVSEQSDGGKAWSLTNQMWHLGEGRIANSRAEFQEMRPGKGLGDEFAYPPDGKPNAEQAEWTLKSVFRTFIGIPIFARGGQTDKVMRPDDDSWGNPDAMRTEFNSQYRVVGILKLEGKHPNFELVDDDWWNALDDDVRQQLERVLGRKRQEALTRLKDLYRLDKCTDNTAGYDLLYDQKTKSVNTKLVDTLTRNLDACWRPEDVELLVSVAMEIGRLLTLRTMKKATDQGLFIGESDIGILDVRARDIDQIAACKTVAQKVCDKVEFELKRIEAELSRERSRKWEETGNSEAPHNPILSISFRRKDDMSLFGKLVEKQVSRASKAFTWHIEEVPSKSEVDQSGAGMDRLATNSPGTLYINKNASLTLPGIASLQAERRVLRGRIELHAERSKQDLYTLTYMGGDVYHGDQQARWELNERELRYPNTDSFCARAFSPTGLRLDDWAAGRVECAFLSDLDLLLDAINARFPHRRIHLSEDSIHRWLEAPQPNGYRALHVTVFVPIDGLVTKKEKRHLAEVLPRWVSESGNVQPGDQQHPNSELVFPCELQIRTAYQGSWAHASHEIQYKRANVRSDLKRYMSYLSGLLYQSDRIMEVVLENIEFDDAMQVELFLGLRETLTKSDFATVQFAAMLANHIHRDDRLYGGMPHYSRLVDIAFRLVREFKVDDPYMLLLAFFHDLWAHDARTNDSIRGDLINRIDATVKADKSGALERLSWRLPRDFKWLPTEEEHWFWRLLQVHRESSGLSIDQSADTRLKILERDCRELAKSNNDSGSSNSVSLEYRGCVLETAIQLSSLAELPHEPLRSRAIEELENIYRVLQRIRQWVGGDVRFVLQAASREIREVAAKLDTPLPIDWDQ